MRHRHYVTVAPWLLLAASGLSVVFLRPVPIEAVREALPLTLLLAVLAAAAARIASSDGTGRPVRLSLSFVLAAFEILPGVSAFFVLLSALAAGHGGGVAGISRRGVRAGAAVALGVALAALAIPGGDRGGSPRSLGTLVALGLFVAVVQASAFLAEALLGSRLTDRRVTSLTRSLRQVLLETVNVPLAWCLAVLLAERAFPLALALAAVVLFGEIAMKALDRALSDLRVTNDVLAARLTELATLHAIGREMLSSLDPTRVFSVVERECRKIFEVDTLAVALADPDTGEIREAHRWELAAPPTTDARPPAGLTAWVALEKRGMRVDDLHDRPEALPFGTEGIPANIRSILAVPLVVEERVTGVLWIRSERPRAYDDHHLSLLTTVAQQAAVALENARRYEMATLDSLTRFFLRDYFQRRLEEEHHRARRYGGSFAVLMLDLDAFKEINDRHGHFHGDRYLRALGAAIRIRLRGADIACRYGGDEFCLLLPETDLEAAGVIAERLRKTVSRLIVEVEGVSLRTTVSIGIAVFPQHDSGDLRGLLLKADQALYQAKRGGRDRVVPFAA